MTQARFLKPAEAEATEVATYLDEQRTGLGDRFEQDLLATVTIVSEYPFSGRAISDLVRQLRLRTFPYNIIYVVDGDQIVIVAVAHHRRRPGYWRSRLALLK